MNFLIPPLLLVAAFPETLALHSPTDVTERRGFSAVTVAPFLLPEPVGQQPEPFNLESPSIDDTSPTSSNLLAAPPLAPALPDSSAAADDSETNVSAQSEDPNDPLVAAAPPSPCPQKSHPAPPSRSKGTVKFRLPWSKRSPDACNLPEDDGEGCNRSELQLCCAGNPQFGNKALYVPNCGRCTCLSSLSSFRDHHADDDDDDHVQGRDRRIARSKSCLMTGTLIMEPSGVAGGWSTGRGGIVDRRGFLGRFNDENDGRVDYYSVLQRHPDYDDLIVFTGSHRYMGNHRSTQIRTGVISTNTCVADSIPH